MPKKMTEPVKAKEADVEMEPVDEVPVVVCQCLGKVPCGIVRQ